MPQPKKAVHDYDYPSKFLRKDGFLRADKKKAIAKWRKEHPSKKIGARSAAKSKSASASKKSASASYGLKKLYHEKRKRADIKAAADRKRAEKAAKKAAREQKRAEKAAKKLAAQQKRAAAKARRAAAKAALCARHQARARKACA